MHNESGIPLDYEFTAPVMNWQAWVAYVGASKMGLQLRSTLPSSAGVPAAIDHDIHNQFVDFVADSEQDDDGNIITPFTFTYEMILRMNANVVDAVELSYLLAAPPPLEVLELIIEVAVVFSKMEEDVKEIFMVDVDKLVANIDTEWENFNA